MKPMNYYKGIMYGISHGGGGEAMVFVGLQTLTNFLCVNLLKKWLKIVSFRFFRLLPVNFSRILYSLYFKYQIYTRLWCLSMICIWAIQKQVPTNRGKPMLK